MQTKIFLFALLIFSGYFSYANNLQIGAVTHTESGSNHYLNFTISWNNSWRTSSAPFNWDAVWVFVKRRDCAGLQWHHANLSAQDTAHSGGSTLFVDAYADKKGVMIYRASDGSGNISNIDIKLKLDSVPAGNYDYQVFGIEMVYVPEGVFYVGDGVSTNSFAVSPTSSPYMVTSENPIQVGFDTGSIYCINVSSSLNTGIQLGTVLPASYPKGYNSFYCMKYEISQGQYASFLSSITQDAFFNRYQPGITGANRYTIQGIWPQINSLSPDRACNMLSFQDLTAYLDWAALSPLTELEYEKACRGVNNIPVGGGLAWANSSVIKANTIASGTDGLATEYINDFIPDGFGIANYLSAGPNPFDGPLRCGFAARTNTTRTAAGASYYGIMEMSGNVMERCYNLSPSNVGGIYFSGTHGDGSLTTTPNAGFSNAGWPDEGFTPSAYFDNKSAARCGGSFSLDSIRLRISNRADASNNNLYFSQYRAPDYGGRGVSRRQQ